MDKPEPDGLNATEIQRALAGQMIGTRVVVLSSATSTNDVIWEMAETGAPQGLVVFTEEQTAGRGQRDKGWESAPRKGLWFSFLLRPGLAPADSGRLTNWIVQTIAHSMTTQFSIPAVIKSPNDVYTQERKIAGFLVELRAHPGEPHLAIAGVGLNTNHQASDFSPSLRTSAISLAM